MADDVLAVLDELGLERVKLVGHDWGGWIGFLLCLRGAASASSATWRSTSCRPGPACGRWRPHLWRFWYQWLILTPGHRLPPAPQRQVRPESPGRRLGRQARSGTTQTLARLLRHLHRAGAGAGGGADVPGLQPARGAGDHRAAATRTQRLRSRPGCSSAPATPPCDRSSSPATSATPTTCSSSSSPAAATSSPTSARTWSPSGPASSSPSESWPVSGQHRGHRVRVPSTECDPCSNARSSSCLFSPSYLRRPHLLAPRSRSIALSAPMGLWKQPSVPPTGTPPSSPWLRSRTAGCSPTQEAW